MVYEALNSKDSDRFAEKYCRIISIGFSPGGSWEENRTFISYVPDDSETPAPDVCFFDICLWVVQKHSSWINVI